MRIWEGLLNVTPIGITDNFFELGGDSILSIQVISRARAQGIGITAKLLFAHPTIKGLSEVAQVEVQEEPYTFDAALIQRLTEMKARYVNVGMAVEDIYPLTPLQNGLLFHSLYEEGSGDYVVQMGFVCEGIELETFVEAWKGLTKQFGIYRLSIVWEDTAEAMQIIHSQTELPVTYLDWTDAGAEDIGTRWERVIKRRPRARI